MRDHPAPECPSFRTLSVRNAEPNPAPIAKSHGSRIRSILIGILLFGFAVGCGPQEPSLAQIQNMHDRGRFEPTIEPLRRRVDRGERDSATLLLYGVALSKSGLHSRALWPLKEAARDPEYYVNAMTQLGRSAYVTGNHDLSIELLSEVLEREPEHLPALRMRCFSRLHTRRDYEGALEDAERALDIDPDSREMLAPRIVALLGLHQVDDAREALAEFADSEPDGEVEEDGKETPLMFRVLACVANAKFAEEDQDLERAGELYDRCLEQFPTESIAVHEAMEFYGSDRFPGKERFDEILKGAYEAAPGDRTFRIAYARRLELLGDIDEARRVLEEASEAGYPGATVDLAGFLAAQEDPEGALATYRKAREQGASGAAFLLSFGEALIANELYDEALSLADETGPESHKAFIRGRVALAREDFPLALEELTKGVVLWPDNAVARYYTAKAAEGAGEIDRAVEEYRNALRIDPSAADSRADLAELHLAEGNPSAALYILQYKTQGDEPLRSTQRLIRLELEAMGWAGTLDRVPPDLLTRIRYPAVWGNSVAAMARGVGKREGAEGAIRVIESADRLDLTLPRSLPALRELVMELQALGRHDDAIARARVAAEKNPEIAEIQALLGQALLGANRVEEADAVYTEALSMDGSNASSLSGRAEVEVARGELEKALATYERIADASADQLLARADLLIRLGRAAEAVPLLQKALIEDPYNGKVAFRLAEAKEKEGAPEADLTILKARAERFRAQTPPASGVDSESAKEPDVASSAT